VKKTWLSLVLVAFSALTVVALWKHGYWGIVAPHFQSFGAGQVFADLVIALSLVIGWIWSDAKRAGRSPWGWIALTVGLGSIGPLLYLISRPAQRK
jgi:hypothetical protein